MSFLNDEQLKYLNGIGLQGTKSSKKIRQGPSELENLLRNDPIAADMYSYGAGDALQQGANSETAGNGFLGWLKDSADAGAASVVGGTARTLGEFMPFGQEAFNSAADYMDEVARRNSPTEELTGMNYVASAIGNALGSGGATMAETAALIGAGKLLGLGGLASGALGLASKTPGLGTLINAGKTMWQSPYGKYLVANVAGSPLEAVAESGNLITDMRNENAQAGYSKYSDEEIRNAALRSAGLNTAWLTAANMLEAGALGKITGALAGNVGERTAKQIARQAILGGGSSAISEGGEEYFQNLIGDYSKRGNIKDLNYDEALEAAKMGAIGGGVLGGLGAGGSAFFAKSNKPKGDIAEEVTSEGETQNTEENFWDNKDNARKAIKDAYSNGMLSKDDARNLLIKLDNGEIGPEAEKVQKERAKQTEQLLEKQRLQGYDDELDQYTDSKSVVEETAPSPAPEPVIQGLTQQQGPQLFDNTLSNVFAQADKDKENAAREAFRQAILGTPTGKGVMPEIINPITGDAFSQPFSLGTITKATQNKALGATPSAYTSRKAMATGNAAKQAINFPAQAGLNQSNMPIGSAQNLRQQVNAANLALAANRGATDKTAFQQQPAQQPSDVNATADRLMAEQAITNLFDNARLLPPEYYANRDAQQQAQAELAERRKALANILGNVATQKWDETQQEYGNRRQQALQNIANIVNARAAGKWDKIEGTNASKQQSVQGIANIVNALAAGRFDKAEADSKANVDAKERQKAAQAIANIVNARAAGMWDSKEAENQAKAEARQAIADIVNARAAQQWDNAEKGKQNEKTEQKREAAKNTQGAKAEKKQNAQTDKNVKKPKEEKPVEQKPIEQKPKEEVPKAENDNKINLPEGITVEVSYNEEKNGVQLKFNKAPGNDVTSKLFRAGFKWSRKNQLWYSLRNNPKAMEIAKQFEGAKEKPNQQQDITTEQDKLDFKREEMTEAFGKLLGIDSVMSYDDAVKKFGEDRLNEGQVVLHIPNSKLYFIVEKYNEDDTAKHGMKYHVDAFDSKLDYDVNNVFDAKNENVVAERVRNPKGDNKPLQWQGRTPEDWMLQEVDRTITDWRGEKRTVDNISYSGGQWWAIFDNGSTMSMESLEEYNRQLQNLTNNKEKALALTEKPQTQATATTFKDNPESLINEDALNNMSLEQLNAINDMFEGSKDKTNNATKPKTETAKPTKKGSKFDYGNKDAAVNDLLSSLGLKKKKDKVNDVEGIDYTDDGLDDAFKELNKELSKLSANPMFNPSLYRAAAKVGLIILKRVGKSFAKWAKMMLDTFKKKNPENEEKIKPYLGAIYKNIENWPSDLEFKDDTVEAACRVVGSYYSEGLTNFDDIYKALSDNAGEEVASQLKGYLQQAFYAIDELENPTLSVDNNVVKSNQEDTAKGGNNNGVYGQEVQGGRTEGSEATGSGVSSSGQTVRGGQVSDGTADSVLGGEQTQNGSKTEKAGDNEGVRVHENQQGGRPTGGESKPGNVYNGSKRGRSEDKTDVAGVDGRGTTGTAGGRSGVITNYHIDDPDALIGGTPKVRFLRNKKAIEVVQELMDNDRPATKEERDAMAAYTGWGSFGQELFKGTWEKPVYKEGWKEENDWLRETLGKEAWIEAQNSIINAHYTDPYTINAMWAMAKKMGFKGGKVLEPSMGVGNFFGLMPKDIAEKSQLTGIELDRTTGRMAQALYPQANIQIKGYQDSLVPDNFYDLIIGNVPFGNFSIADRKYGKLKPLIHDFFFLKGIDQLKPGGLMMAITSKGSLDKADARVRMELAQKADLVAAFRLPTGAFDKYAGTNVVTDILIFKKLDTPRTGVNNIGWVKSSKYVTRFKGNDETYYYNDYYKEHPENVLGVMEFGHGTTTGRPGLTVRRLDNFGEKLKELSNLVPKNIFSANETKDNVKYISNHQGGEQGSVVIGKGDNNLYTVYGEQLKPLQDTKSYIAKNQKQTAQREQEFRDWLELRDVLGQLYDAERNDAPNIEELRSKLNTVFDNYYRNYVEKLSAKQLKDDQPAFRQSFANKYMKAIEEPSAARVMALVDDKGRKAAIFSKRSVRGSNVNIKNPTIAQALIMQRNENVSNLDIDRIAKLANKTKDEVISELTKNGTIFKTPAGNYEVKDVYLAGNVRQKLREAEDALQNGDKDMQANIQALKNVIPATVPYYNISTSLGATWIPQDVYKQFVAYLLGVNSTDKINITKTKGFTVDFENKQYNNLSNATTVYGIDAIPFNKLLTHAFNHTKPLITTRDEYKNVVEDTKAMEAANDKLEKIYDAFNDWLWKDNGRKLYLENEYNEIMNAIAVPTYDGSFMDMPGMALLRGDSQFSLRKHQLNAIYRGLINGSGVYAHEVGTGKTYTMAGLAVESRRYGLAKKPLLLAFNANSASVAKEINDMYPGAKVLYIDNMDRNNIKLKLNQIRTDDWDCVVMPHSLAEKLSFQEETLMNMAEKQIYALEQAAIEAAAQDGEKLTVEQMEELRTAEKDQKVKIVRSQTAKKLVTMRNQIINQIKQNALNASTEDAIPFEELGVDMVLVDEAHAFKKPPFTTTRKIKGLTTDSSNRAIQLSFITQYIQSINNGRGVHLFTGTPITNTLTEMYHMMRYVMPKAMEDANILDFDSWMNSFAEETADMEFTSTGDVEMVSRLASFTNVPELRRFVGQYWDTVFADDMPEFSPRKTSSGKTITDKLTDKENDELLNGYTQNPQGRPYKKVIIETLKLTSSQNVILKDLVAKAKAYKEASKQEKKLIARSVFHGTPLLIGNDASLAGMDPRLYDVNINTEGEETKIDRCVSNVLKIYNEGTASAPTVQVIFTDVGYKDTKTRSIPVETGFNEWRSVKETVPAFNMARAIVNQLVEQGIPEKEIVIMKSSYSAEKRAQIADMLKTGTYRVVIGSTATLGVGVNMQDNLRAMHHLDCPWMPGDLIQRNGRGHRQGNHWNTVLEYRYVTEKLDTKRWQTVLRKDAFINSFMKSKIGDNAIRSFEMGADDLNDKDTDSDLLQTLSDASGDPRVIIQKKYEINLAKLKRKERTFVAGIEDVKAKLGAIDNTIKNRKISWDNLAADAKTFAGNKKETFGIKLVNSLKPGQSRNLIAFDNRVDAQKHLEELLRQVANIGTDNHIGEYAGFSLEVRKEQSTIDGTYTPVIRINGQGEYVCGTPTINGITANAGNIPGKVSKAQEAYQQAVNDKAILQEAVKETFPQQELLDKTTKQLEEIKQDRLLSPTPPPAWLTEGVTLSSTFYVNGNPYSLVGYRANSDGYYLVGEYNGQQTVFPFQDATDIQGMPIYDMTTHVPSPAYKPPEIPKEDNKKNITQYSVAPTNDIQYSIAYHGTPHKFNEFDTNRIGSGVGGQIYGWGLYFTEDEAVAQTYRQNLSASEEDGQTLEVEVPDDDVLLDYDLPFSEQPPKVQAALRKAAAGYGRSDMTVDGILDNFRKNIYIVRDLIENKMLKKSYRNVFLYDNFGSDVMELAEAYLNKENIDDIKDSIFENINEQMQYAVEQEMVDDDSAAAEKLSKQLTDEAVKTVKSLIDEESSGSGKIKFSDNMYGEQIYQIIARTVGSDKDASLLLNKYGIKGLTYNGGNEGKCYVLFDAKSIKILRQYMLANNDIIPTRSRAEVEAEIRTAFPNGTIEYTNGVPIVTLPNGVKFQYSIRENIIVNAREQKRANAAHGTSGGIIQGFWQKFSGNGVQRLLAVAQNSERGTAFHEAMHAAIDLALTEKEANALRKYYQNKAKEQNRNVDEVIADAYRDWVLARQQKRGTVFGKLWQKIKDFCVRIRSLFDNGAEVQRIMQDVESGKVYERGANNSNIKKRVYFSKVEIEAQKGSGTTQVKGTRTMYVKALKWLRTKHPGAKTVLDYGAGMGLGTEDMRSNNPDMDIECYEPNPQRWEGSKPPTYTNNTQINKDYDLILNTNVLNVVEKPIRDLIVRDIASHLNMGGKALITTRGWEKDVAVTQNVKPAEEYHAVWVDKGKKGWVFQKGFDGDELKYYIKQLLGDSFVVEKTTPTFGKASVTVTRVATRVKPKADITKQNNSYKEMPDTYKTLKGSPIKRSKYGVGKLIGGQIYLHKDYALDVIPKDVWEKALKVLKNTSRFFQYNCVMYDTKTGNVRFDEAPDFDTAREPIVGDTLTVKPDGTTKRGHSNYIWHHKWIWVKNDYQGFDVNESKAWSQKWLGILTETADGNGIERWNAQLDRFGLEHDGENIQYSVAAPKSKIASAFTNTERKGTIQSVKDFFKEHWKSFYSDYVDKNDVLHAFDVLTNSGLTLYEQVQNLPSTTAGFLKAISEGTAAHIDAANKHLKNVKMKHRVTLAMALDTINKETMDKAHPDYLAQNGFDSWVNAFGAYLGAERLLEMNSIAKAQGEEYKLPKGLTEAELQQFVRNAPMQFKKAADIFYKVNDNMLSVMEDAGVFSHDLAQLLRTKYKKYCPLLRDFSDTAAADNFINGLTTGGRGIGNVSIPLKKISISGSERGVLNPLETVLKSYAVMLNRAERNKVGLMAVNSAKEAGMEDIIEEVPEIIGKNGEVVNAVADPKNCVFTVLVNGKKKAYKTTPELYGPIVGYNVPAAGLVFGVARTAAKMLRTGATMSPSFILRNVLRDTFFAGISSKNGFIPILDTLRGMNALWNDPAMRAEFEAAGVTEFNFYSSQEQRIKSIDAMAGEKPVGPLEMIKWAFRNLEAASDFMESATRMGEFMKARGKGLSIEEAARAAREVTLDFSRSGRVGEQINQVVPFFNACVQGGDKMRRLLREDFRGTATKLFKYIVLPSIILWAMNYDEDWYKDLDPDIKNNYWCLGKNVRIPKPQEAGVLFGSGFEALLDQANGKDPKAMANWAKAFMSNMTPGIVPTLFLPLLEWQANYSYFKGRPLVSSKYQRLPDELQYNDYTSELSKSIGNNPLYKVSPMKVDNLVRGYTGTMGALLWSLPDYATDKAKNQPARNWYEYTPFRDFTVTDANMSRPLNDFYGMLDAANRQHTGYGVKGKPTQAVQAIRKTGTMISNIRKDIDKITKSKLTAERKRQLIDQRKAKMNQLARQANERYGKYFD